MLTAYVDAYRVFGEKAFLDRALDNAGFLIKYMIDREGRLDRVLMLQPVNRRSMDF